MECYCKQKVNLIIPPMQQEFLNGGGAGGQKAMGSEVNRDGEANSGNANPLGGNLTNTVQEKKTVVVLRNGRDKAIVLLCLGLAKGRRIRA